MRWAAERCVGMHGQRSQCASGVLALCCSFKARSLDETAAAVSKRSIGLAHKTGQDCLRTISRLSGGRGWGSDVKCKFLIPHFIVDAILLRSTASKAAMQECE